MFQADFRVDFRDDFQVDFLVGVAPPPILVATGCRYRTRRGFGVVLTSHSVDVTETPGPPPRPATNDRPRWAGLRCREPATTWACGPVGSADLARSLALVFE